MTAIVIQGNAMALPLPDECVDLVVTSPPYFGLRSYTDDGQHISGQVGGEATPLAFIDALIAATAEMVRVLKPSGSIFVNLGDKYAGSGMGGNKTLANSAAYIEQRANGYHPCAAPDGSTASGSSATTSASAPSASANGRKKDTDGIRAKSLMFLPERYRIAGVDRLGLIARAVIVWDKPNGLPESVCDRVRRSHEDWVHLTKMPRYFSAIDEIREDSQQGRPQARRAAELAARAGLTQAHKNALKARGLGDVGRGAATQNGTGKNTVDVLRLAAEADRALGGYAREFLLSGEALGKLPGSVWRIPTAPLSLPAELGVDHFAAFPPEWPKRIIQGWSPAGVCVECGEGRRPVVLTTINGQSVVPNLPRSVALGIQNTGGAPAATWGVRAKDIDRVITGSACDCADTTALTAPAIVLDPFGGTGTTAMVAHALGRVGISVDLSHDYCRVAQWRTHDRAQIAKVRDEIFRKPVPQSEDQTSLFTFAAVAQGGKQ